VEKHGALLSEAPMGMEPLANMFPQRNRIISGLSRAVIVVEAAEKSGALWTAEHALEHGRPVFAVPGPVDHVSSGGTNKLIRSGAILIRGIDDILEELDGIKSTKPAAATPTPADLNPTQQRVWDFLGSQTRHVDEIARHLGVAVHELTGHLMMMEMKRAIRRLPGNMYERR
jgi:DNA processing protein